MLYINIDDDILICPWRKEVMLKHETQYRHWMECDNVTRHNSHGLFPYTRQKMDAFWSEIESGQRIVWAIERIVWCVDDGMAIDKNILLGNCALQSISWINRSAEFAIVIGETCAYNKGIGTQCLRWLLNHAFSRLGLNRVWSGTSAENLGMRKVFDKVGMTQEGVFREGLWNRGRFVDVLCYGILAKEWRGGADEKA